MKIPDKGYAETELFKKLEAFREHDLKWDEGKMFGHAFLADETARKIAERAYTSYLWENALDPTLFPSLLELEKQVVAMATRHLRGDDKVVGNFTSGGTESILLAVKTARDKARSEKPQIKKPRMVLPVTAHAAFHKAAHYFDVTPVLVPVDPENFKADVNAIEDAITPDTILLVASAPSYAHGVIDPVPAIGKIALDNDILFHIDGCMGAFLLPYYRALGVELTDFDFSVPGVTSISMDFHKYAFAAKGASMVLYKNKEIRLHQIFACSDWTGYTLINPTIQSSRSGGALAATWAMLNYLGNDGYLDIVKKLIDATDKIIDGINSIDGIYVLGKPEMCLVGVGSDTVGIFHIVDEMKERGWHIQAQFGHGPLKENFHLTILPFNIARIDEWIKELRDSVDAAKAMPPDKMAAQLAQGLSKLDPMEISAESIKEMFGAVGVGDSGLPSRMAGINEILNALPPKLADRLFAVYFNDVSNYKPEEKV